jgi:VanZ family protein
VRRILLMVLALILYGSLYPWQFHAVRFGVSPLWILLHSWPGAINRYVMWDITINMALYLPLGVFGYLAMGPGTARALRLLAPLLLATVLSASVEMLQLFDLGRECSASDVAANVAGAALGTGLAALYRRKLEGALRKRAAEQFLHLSGALLLVCCWLGYQLFPLFPAWGRTRLLGKLRALGPLSTLSPVSALLIFVEWLTLACLLDGMLEKKAGRAIAVFLMVLPARLLVADRTLTWADLAGVGAALLVWLLAPRVYVRRAAPALLAGALVIGEFAPFHFTHAAPFNWVPFRGFFESPWQSGLVILFRKSFWYGSVIWLWRSAGYPLPRVTAVAALVLGVLEAVQIYLPGRVPEITDAVLAVLMGVVLWLADPPPAATP